MSTVQDRSGIALRLRVAAPRNPGRIGFTLVELLVVVGILAILAALLVPALATAKLRSQTTTCQNNLKQLVLAWTIYANDSQDSLPANKWLSVDWGDGCPSHSGSSADSWVISDAATDRTFYGLQQGSLWVCGLTKSTQIYHCPTDRSGTLLIPGLLRNRSYSLSYYMNGSPGKPERQTKLTSIRPPAKAFVFLDESEISIGEGAFFVHVPNDAGEQSNLSSDPQFEGAHWMQLPGDRHNQGCDLTFADGHAEYWKWLWTKQWGRGGNDDVVCEPDFKDMRRLQKGIPQP